MTGFVNNLSSAISRRARVRPAPTRLRPSTLQVESLEQRSLLTAMMPVGAPLPDSPAADDVVVDGRIITGENFDSANSSDQSIVRKITGRTNYQPAGASAFGGGAGHDVIFGGLGGEGDLQSASAGGHTGGVNVLFGDGSVRFVSDSIARSGPFQSEYKYVPVRRMPLYASGDTGADFRGRQIDYTGLEQTSSFSAFGGFTGGVYVAAGDVNGDGRDDIIIGAGPGAPGGHVKVIDGTRLGDLGNDWLVGGTGRDNVAATTGRVNYFNGRFLPSPDLNAAGAGIDVLIFGMVGDENDDTASATDK
jgi:prepilin-type processing-associated H-X9-DG protein